MTAPTETVELQPCPFCGDYDPEVAESSVPNIHGGHKQAVYCNACFCEGPTADTEAEAIAAWNRRASRSPVVGAVGGEPTQAAMDVLAERERQKTVEGWTPEHDDRYADNELARAAEGYVTHYRGRKWTYDEADPSIYCDEEPPQSWPWDEEWWKPKSPRRDLVRAAALLLAEIERLDRGIGVSPTGSPEGEVSR